MVTAQEHVRCSSLEQKNVQLCLTCRPYCQVQVSGAHSGATLPVEALQGTPQRRLPRAPTLALALAVASPVLSRPPSPCAFFSSLRLCSSRRWRRSAISGLSANYCSTNVFFKALWSEPSIMASITCSSIFMAGPSPKSTEIVLTHLLGGRSLVNHHHQHLPLGLHSNLIPIARITGSSLFLLVHLPPQHRDTRNCPREATRPMRHHWLPRFEATDTPRDACSVCRRSRTSVQHEMLFWVCAPAIDPVDGNFRTRHRSLGLCVINAKSTGFEQMFGGRGLRNCEAT